MSLFEQSQNTRYENNEFDNMPSIDYGGCNCRITKYNMDIVDWDKVNEICKKHGFDCTIINSTFGGDKEIDVLIKVKCADLTNAYYDERYKAKDWKTLRELNARYEKWFFKLHDCLHELDLETNLYFNCGWSGNCGLFGSHDVKRTTYSFADSLKSYTAITNWLSPLIHDTNSKLDRNGVYIMGHTCYAKIDTKFVFNEFENELALTTAKELYPDYNIKFEEGKRQCDPCSYTALVVRTKKDEYIGAVTFVKDKHGIVHITTMVPLCGQNSFMTTKDTFRDDLKAVLRFIIE